MSAVKTFLCAMLATCGVGGASAEPAYLMRFKASVVEQSATQPPVASECATIGERCADGSRVIGFSGDAIVKGRLEGGADRASTFTYADALAACAASGGLHVPSPAETETFGAGLANLGDAEGLADQYYWTTHDFWGTHRLVEHRSSAAIRSTVAAPSERWRVLCIG